jgi:hypothetical protein
MSGVQAHYKLDGNLNDASVNGYNLTNVNATNVVNGVIGQCYDFETSSGHGAYIDTCPNLNIGGVMTIIAFINPESSTEGSIVCKDNVSAGYTFDMVSNNTLRGIFRSSAGVRGITSTFTVTNGKVTMVGFILDTATKYISKMCKDGSGAFESAADANVPLTGSASFSLGYRKSDNSVHFDGQIDEVIVLNRAISLRDLRLYSYQFAGRLV